MNLRRFVTVAAAVAVGAALSGGTAPAATAGPESAVRPATFIGYDKGYGATLAAAELDATNQLEADYYGCLRPFIASYGQEADGSWWAQAEANGCQGYN